MTVNEHNMVINSTS